MTLAANISEQPDPRIARAEMWLCMLGGLREVARRFGRFLVNEIVPHRAWSDAPALAFAFFFDPAPAFKRVMFAASFVAKLCQRIEKEIAALKAGEPCDFDAFLFRKPDPSARSKRGLDAANLKLNWENLLEFEDYNEFENYNEREAPERYFSRLNRQSQQEKYAALLEGPLKDAIKAICADLGLKPNWRLWTDNGFPPPGAGGVEDWVAFFVPDADRRAAIAEARRAPKPPHLGARPGALPSSIPPQHLHTPPPLHAGAARPPDPGGSP